MHATAVCINVALMATLLPAKAFSAAAATIPAPASASAASAAGSWHASHLHRPSPLCAFRPPQIQGTSSRLSRALQMTGGAAGSTAVVNDRRKPGFGIASSWGVISVLAILGNAIKRLAPIAAQPFKNGDLTRVHWSVYVGFTALMAYAEGYNAFQKKFSPMVVQRALTLDQERGALRVVLAGPFSMGLFHASRKRKIVSWTLSFAVLGLVQAVKKLAYPWRSIIDAGVVAGLSWGSAAIVYYWVRSWFGAEPGVDAQMPDKEPAKTKA